MADHNTNCPRGSDWLESQFSKRTCGRNNNNVDTCYSATLPFITQQTFSRVCGRVRAYAYGGVDAFENSNLAIPLNGIDDSYVSGVSLTIDNPRRHVWTFAAGLGENGRTDIGIPNAERIDQCPCDVSNLNINIPDFVGSDYFCESGLVEFDGTFGFQADDPLWDGLDCNPESNCCECNRPPYFVKDLGTSFTTDNIEARICLKEGGPNNIGNPGDDILVEVVEIYVAP